MAELSLRLAMDEDSAGIISLIDACYKEYPPNVLLVDEEEPELRTPASSFAMFWVLCCDDEIVGTVAASMGRQFVELKKMYLQPSLRGSGWAQRLQKLVVDFAFENKKGVELWTDTRFVRAHAFYKKCGWLKTGQTRELKDASVTTEFHFIYQG